MVSTELATKSDISKLDQKIDRAVDDITAVIREFADQVDRRFNELEERMKRLEESYDRLLNTLDSHYKKLEDMEIENHARDAEFVRLKEWAIQTSKKTGVKLEY